MLVLRALNMLSTCANSKQSTGPSLQKAPGQRIGDRNGAVDPASFVHSSASLRSEKGDMTSCRLRVRGRGLWF